MLEEIMDFISSAGLAFLCGVGLGLFFVVVLMVLRKTTPQRVKWVMLGCSFGILSIYVAFYAYAVLSPKQEDQIREGFQAIPDLEQAETWYEYTYFNSSATGRCGNTTTYRWLGLNTVIESQTIVDWYNHQLVEDGWELESTIWQKDTSQGIFTFNIDIFPDPAMIDSGQDFYSIPDEALQKTQNYQTVYVLELNLISHESLARCFSS